MAIRFDPRAPLRLQHLSTAAPVKASGTAPLAAGKEQKEQLSTDVESLRAAADQCSAGPSETIEARGPSSILQARAGSPRPPADFAEKARSVLDALARYSTAQAFVAEVPVRPLQRLFHSDRLSHLALTDEERELADRAIRALNVAKDATGPAATPLVVAAYAELHKQAVAEDTVRRAAAAEAERAREAAAAAAARATAAVDATKARVTALAEAAAKVVADPSVASNASAAAEKAADRGRAFDRPHMAFSPVAAKLPTNRATLAELQHAEAQVQSMRGLLDEVKGLRAEVGATLDSARRQLAEGTAAVADLERCAGEVKDAARRARDLGATAAELEGVDSALAKVAVLEEGWRGSLATLHANVGELERSLAAITLVEDQLRPVVDESARGVEVARQLRLSDLHLKRADFDDVEWSARVDGARRVFETKLESVEGRASAWLNEEQAWGGRASRARSMSPDMLASYARSLREHEAEAGALRTAVFNVRPDMSADVAAALPPELESRLKRLQQMAFHPARRDHLFMSQGAFDARRSRSRW